VVPLLLAACGGGGQGGEAARPDSVGIALEQYSPTLFDTISWTADSAAANRGSVVWTFSCRKCHGETGHGDGHFVVEVKDTASDAMVPDTITPPDFTTPGWRFAADKEGLIKYIYSGNDKQMPHWGIQGLKPRDIDAVANYIQKVLAPGLAKPDSAAAAPVE
jgi:mono/diheme cytochrome c family protein